MGAPEAELLVIGDWAPLSGMKNVRQRGWLEGETLHAALRSAAVALFPVQDTALARAKSPARLLDCLAEGLPIVTENTGEYGILTGPGGRVVGTADDLALIDQTVALLRDRDLRGRARPPGLGASRPAHLAPPRRHPPRLLRQGQDTVCTDGHGLRRARLVVATGFLQGDVLAPGVFVGDATGGPFRRLSAGARRSRPQT